MVSKKQMALAGLIFSAFFLVTDTQAAEKKQTSDVSAYYYYNNNPIYSVQIQATNYDTAFKKLKKGKFKKSDFQHFSLDDVKKRYQVDGMTVHLSDQLSFGKGIRLTDDQANEALKILYHDAPGYLTFINDFEKSVILHNPASTRYRFSNEEGLSIGTVTYGKTIFMNSADDTFQLVDVDEAKETLYLGNTIPAGNRIEVEAAKVDNDYTADLGQSITYRIKVDEGKNVEVDLSPNFALDSVNASYEEKLNLTREEEGLAGSLSFLKKMPEGIKLTSNDLSVSVPYDKDVETNIKTAIAELQSTKTLAIDEETIQGDYLEVTGHVESVSAYTIETTTNDKVTSDRQYWVDNQNSRQGIYVKENGKYLLTPEIYSNNLNFVMMDGSTHQLLQGAKYILGRVDSTGKVAVLEKGADDQLAWTATKLDEKSLKELKSNYWLEGNRIIYLDGHVTALPFDKDLWAYNEKNQTESNSALFKLRGLSDGYTYFLKQAEAPKGYALSDKIYTFKADKDSETKAQFGDYQVNGFVQDAEYGLVEYNALSSVKEGEKETTSPNPKVIVGLFIATSLLLIAGLGYLVIKKG